MIVQILLIIVLTLMYCDSLIPEDKIAMPWENVPKNIIFYDKFFDDGHIGAFTDNAELAFKLGIFHNRVLKSDLYRADNGFVYLKDRRTL